MTVELQEQPYLEYLHCLECDYVLSTVTEYEGRTSIAFVNVDGTELTIFRALLIRPNCGAKREFYSDPLSGVRLGIT